MVRPRAAALAAAVLVGATLAWAQPAAAAPLVSVALTATPATSAPDTSGALAVLVKNTGDVALFRVQVHVEDADTGLTFDEGSLFLGDLGLTQTASGSLLFRVGPDAAPGYYRVELRVRYDSLGRSDSVEQTATLTVQATPSLVLRSVEPGVLALGGATQVTFTVANEGAAVLTNVDAAWTTPRNVVLPLGGGNRVLMPRLEPGEAREVTLWLGTGPGAVPGVVPLFFNATFRDASGATLTSRTVVGLQVGGLTTFRVAVQEVTRDALTIAVTNAGSSPAKGVELRIAGGPVALSDTDTLFLGDLAPGAVATAEFEVANRPPTGEALRVVVGYTDVGGERRTEPQDVRLPDAAGGASATEWSVGVGVAVLLLGGGAFASIRVRKARAARRAAERSSEGEMEAWMVEEAPLGDALGGEGEPSPPRSESPGPRGR